jgi:hypothetical protein
MSVARDGPELAGIAVDDFQLGNVNEVVMKTKKRNRDIDRVKVPKGKSIGDKLTIMQLEQMVVQEELLVDDAFNLLIPFRRRRGSPSLFCTTYPLSRARCLESPNVSVRSGS